MEDAREAKQVIRTKARTHHVVQLHYKAMKQGHHHVIHAKW